MSITVVTAASTRNLTSVAAVMRDIGPDGIGADLLMVEAMIAEASAAIESECHTIFAQQKYTETFDWQRDPVLILRYSPLVSVTEVLIGTTVITDYRIRSYDAALLWRTDGWKGYDASVPEISVTYTAGYRLPEQTAPVEPTGPALPADLSRAVLECVKIWQVEVVPSSRVQSKTFGLTGDRVDYGVQATKRGIPILAEYLLKAYHRLVMV